MLQAERGSVDEAGEAPSSPCLESHHSKPEGSAACLACYRCSSYCASPIEGLPA